MTPWPTQISSPPGRPHRLRSSPSGLPLALSQRLVFSRWLRRHRKLGLALRPSLVVLSGAPCALCMTIRGVAWYPALSLTELAY